MESCCYVYYVELYLIRYSRWDQVPSFSGEVQKEKLKSINHMQETTKIKSDNRWQQTVINSNYKSHKNIM